jgi:hypothetical protein
MWDDIRVPPGRRTAITADYVVPITKGGGNGIENHSAAVLLL